MSISLLDICEDQALFGQWFRDRATWQAWFAFIACLFALPMTAEHLQTYTLHTSRTLPPAIAISEAWLICGRRAGKSFVLALIAVFLACFKNYGEYLGPGERATVIVIAADRKQARQIYRYIRGLITGTPLLAEMIQGEPRADGLDLTNSVTIEIGTASYKTNRGYSFCAVLCDELAYWGQEDSAAPDYAILDALRPGMANIPGSVLLCASSPYARRGALHDAYKNFFGKDDPEVLVWKAATRQMNPTIPQSIIDRAIERDPASAAAEYGAEFRSDMEAFVSREVIEAVVVPGRYELPPISSVSYSAFVDSSAGSRDAMTLAIGHREGEVVVLDALRERKPPFSPEAVVSEFSILLKSYGIKSVRGDRYAGEWPRERFRVHGIEYAVSEISKSEIYGELLPLLNSGRVELLDVPSIKTQLLGLERRTARGGRDTIDHAPNSFDDVINSVAGVLVATPSRQQTYNMMSDAVLGTQAEQHASWRGLNLINHIYRSG